jgi:hypothetical protein
MTDRTIHDFHIVVDPSLGPYEMRMSTLEFKPITVRVIGEMRIPSSDDTPLAGILRGALASMTRTPVAPFKNRQRIAIPGGRIATVESMRRNRAEGTAAFGAWMVEARADGINPETGKYWPIETHFASECRE